ncbi:MAG: LD-carboxypeptidase [Lachnospiraceae bacterium]|nr:LD-carboxypeptidase [Lachnospiraceae bacterium]
MRYPHFISKSDTIGFPAPSFGCATEPYSSCFDAALKYLEGEGFGILEGPNSRAAEGIGISNLPEKCGRELTDMYLSDANNALITCGGGEMMCEILEYVDLDAMKESAPKWVMGFSDITNIIYPLVTICDTAAIYGTNAPSFGVRKIHDSVLTSLEILKGKCRKVHSYDMYEIESLRSEEDPFAPINDIQISLKSVYDGKALSAPGEFEGSLSFSGRLIGGCMDCLENLIGTSFDRTADFLHRYSDDGVIFCLESCDLNVFSIRRAMWHFEKAGWFEKGIIKGFLIGRPYNGDPIINLDHINAVMPYIRKYDCPAVLDCDLGHNPPSMPLVMGCIGHVNVSGNDLEIDMEFA